jgi:integrase/recombinase XerD
MRLVTRTADDVGMEDRAFPAVLRRFDRHLDILGRADTTRRKYRYELVRWWTDYLFPGELEVADIRPGHIEEYVGALPRNGSKRGDAIRALRAFFAWAVVEGEVDRDPAAHVPIPRPKVPPAPDLSDDDLRRLLRAAFRREPRRGWAILLCYVTGARVGSLVAARPCDVHLGPDARLDLLEAKGGKPYSVPLERAGVIAASHLVGSAEHFHRGASVQRAAHPSRAAEGASESWQPGSRPDDTRLLGVGAERFRQWVHAAEQEAGLGRVWPHLLRHAASTRVARSSDPETWRRFMNHADLSQWARYVAGTDERVRAAVPTP